MLLLLVGPPFLLFLPELLLLLLYWTLFWVVLLLAAFLIACLEPLHVTWWMPCPTCKLNLTSWVYPDVDLKTVLAPAEVVLL